ncbi:MULTISPECIES: hypothetical protein [unclassified Streptomyces]|uniref:hypothetical protein n=1 Tax=unclassified Streptomyces TaxID=2593676 RepID=UPI0001C19911|nr:hypothetical protein SACTE_2985 [Streptomyces sp. SirexAA-E]MYR69256.1 hypothetical protein [Streptomyces sp. SID4939]MYS01051.1 hypothetical protein [Streptomyces sp. SID4940]MYT63878.1 hypothetical protein [Streptomyces sp. SID8357]MYT86128.1 hypothetical protein [Streptomyces sp. SID8360]MYW38321.1 hypothetical protein [Streptomyces sp. SID1]PZX41849.1 hypothetical protein K373_02078 [Streptomyces sp. DvalAA-21]RAJ38246.1 hypothetical protein K351_01825 [Streptomyces sp. DpondAA-E10]R
MPADIPAKTSDGEATTMRRWVLQEQVWTKVLYASGFTRIGVERRPATIDMPRSADTLLVNGVRQA